MVERIVDEFDAGTLPAIHIDAESAKLYHPATLTGKFPVDPELVVRCQRAGSGRYRGVCIGKMLELYPYDAMKKLALSQAKTFIRHMRSQGYEPLQEATELELWGPFRERGDMSRGASLVNFEEDNPFVPAGHWGSAARGAWRHDLERGPRRLNQNVLLDDKDWRHGVVFLVRGQFLATRGKQEESTGAVLV